MTGASSKTMRAAGRLALAVFVPLALLAGAEGLLRAAGVGYPTSFLLPHVIVGAPHWVDNPFYGYRFFAPELARNPAPIAVAQTKPADTVRVVVLGESAAQGDPMLEYGLPRVLEKVLNHGSATTRYEVINAAMTAISSPVIADIAREIAPLQPDVVVVYMGNNEVVGPYGPGTVFTARGFSAMTPLRVALTRLRLAQALRDATEAARARKTPVDAWNGLAMFGRDRFAANDPRLRPMYRRFQGHIERIVATSRRAGARVIVCTVAVNLADCPPFDGEEARAAHSAGRFEQARDLDTLRFRADSRINTLIRETAARTGAELVDAEALFREAAGGPPGAAFFLDHVHFTFTGTWRLAREVAASIRHEPADALATEDEARRLVFFTPWAERQQAVLMIERLRRPPFAGRPGNDARLLALGEAAERCAASILTQDLAQVESGYRALADSDPDDFFVPFHWAAILADRGRWSEAVPELTRALARVPLHFETRLLPATALARLGRVDEAAAILAGGGGPYGHYLAEYTLQVARTLEQAGFPDEARRFREAVLVRVPRFPLRERVEAEAHGSHHRR